jgi:hypothetical protein
VSFPDDIPGLGRKGDRPQPGRGASAAAVSLSPVEGFVLSRVDGQTSYADICQLTGLGVEATLEILRKLKRERLIANPGEPVTAPVASSPAPAPAPPAPAPAPAPTSAARPAAPPSLLEALDDGSPVDPGDLVPGKDLDDAVKARILRLHRRLKALKPHELLGVAATAEPATVKRAYFAASKELHPDRFFGKDLGPFRERLSDIFVHVGRAFEELQKRR